MPIYSPIGFLDITNATLRTSNTECQNLQIGSGNVYVTTDLTSNLVLNLENITNLGNSTSNTMQFTNATKAFTTTAGIDVTGTVTATAFSGSGAALTNIPPSAITGTLSQWSDGTNSDVYIASNVGIGNVHTLTSNTLQVGANLYVRDADANVLTVTGNVAASYFEGDGSKLTGISSTLQAITTAQATTTDTVSFLNATTGFTVASNILVTGNVTAGSFMGDGSGLTGIASNLHQAVENGNVTSNVVQFSNATTGLVTTANIEVGGDLKIGGLTAGTVPYVDSDKFLKDSFISITGDTTVITSNLDVMGNVFMRGERFIVESETKLINDAIIGIANNNVSSTTDIGILMQRPDANVAIIHHGGTNELSFAYTQDHLEATDITNDLSKELTMNVVGHVITQNNLTVGGTLKLNTITAAATHSLQAVTGVGSITSNMVQFSNAITSLTADSNIVVTGNVTAATFIGDGSLLTGVASNLHQVTENGNVTSTTIQLTNATTGLVATGNVEASKFVGDGSLLTGLASNLHQVTENGNVTSTTIQLTNATTGLVATGNVEASKFVGDGSLLTGLASNLHQVAENGNVTSNTIQFTNATTGLVATGNVEASKFIGDGSSLTGVAPAEATPGIAYQQELLDPTPTAGDWLGYSISVSGDGMYAIVGSPYDDTTSSNQGAVHVFIRSGTSWTRQQKLVAPTPGSSHNFGWSVSISDNGLYAIVGVPEDSEGVAHVFIRSGATWTHQQELGDPNGVNNDQFGWSVSISADGTYAIVGAPEDGTGGTQRGAVHAFIRSGTSWTHQQEMVDSGGNNNDHFGTSVSISNDGVYALIGSPDDAVPDYTGASGAGSSHIFIRSGTSWTEQQRLVDPVATANENFGVSVSISSDGMYALIGAERGVGSGDEYQQGEAHIFIRSGTSWTHQQKINLTTGFTANKDYFGHSVSISNDGTRALIGTNREGSNFYGAGYVFNRSGSSWTLDTKLTDPNKEQYDQVGSSVAISGDGVYFALGAIYDDGDGTTVNSGAAHVFGTNPPFNITRITNLEADVASNVSKIAFITSTADATTVTSNLDITGNLTVLGTMTTVDTDNLRVKDPIIELGKDNTASPIVDLGLILTRPTGNSNVAIIFDESTDKLEIGYTQGNASQASIAMETAAANPISVNVNGTVTATAFAGNASTASALATSVNIGGVAFDGSEAIVPTTFNGATFDTDTLVVDATNNRVGIGTTNPDCNLEIYGDTSSLKLTRSRNNTNYGCSVDFALLNSANEKFTYGRVSGSIADNTDGSEDGVLSFQVGTNGNIRTNYQEEKMRILSNGNVGIGTSSPATALEISRNFTTDGDKSAMISFTNTATGYYEWQIGPTIYSGAAGFGIKGGADGFGSISDIIAIRNTNVGIGTDTPLAKFHVEGGSGNYNSTGYNTRWIYHNNAGVFGPTYTLDFGSVGIYATSMILTKGSLVSTAGVMTSSDRRMKTDIIDVDDGSALETLRLLKPKQYNYLDTFKLGSEPVWGFIAQEVRETLPYATKLSRDTIPNILEFGSVTDSNVITFSNLNTTSLETTSNVMQVITSNDHEKRVHITEIIDSKSIRVLEDLTTFIGDTDESGNVISGNKIFVVGQEVDDFIIVKKDAIWTVATAALQEVDRQQQADKARITALEARILALENA